MVGDPKIDLKRFGKNKHMDADLRDLPAADRQKMAKVWVRVWCRCGWVWMRVCCGCGWMWVGVGVGGCGWQTMPRQEATAQQHARARVCAWQESEHASLRAQ